MIWSHNENWMVTGDDGGAIKYAGPFTLYRCWILVLNNVTLFDLLTACFEFFTGIGKVT